MKTHAVHWIGGVKHARGERLHGWPCCCTGERCERLAAQEHLCTRIPERVTCKACLRWMRRDLHWERWGLDGETCANGDGRPVCPPSKVICRECMDMIGKKMQAILDDLEIRSNTNAKTLAEENE